ncbi:hypothetical protein FOFC_13989 [Fusarium oxysporum]|nr:hypothetical protein FOFC_13989 [Fusarium oxysporum]
MAQSTNANCRAIPSITPSTISSDLDASPSFDPSDTNREVAIDTSSSVDYTGYEGIDWNRLSGYCIRKQRRRPRTGWVWEHGFDIEKDDSGRRFWLCKDCHGKKATITHIYDAASTSQANGHMEDVHRINRDGPMSPQRKKQRTLFDMADLDCRRPKDQAVMNAFIASFDPVRFQHLLVRWVACDNVPFNKLESPYFRELMGYANSAIIESGSLPTHTTIRDWIVRSFNRHKGVVTEILGRSLGRINISFDAWSSRKFTSLLGLAVHFLDDEGKFRTFLLGLPQIEGPTKRLEGRPKEGKFGAIWEVLLTMEWLLKHLEEFKVQHELDEEPHLRIGCNLGWMKLDRYYTLTEDSPVYLAALILHPAFRWSTVESQWGDHPDWLVRGKAAVQELWEEYRNLPVEQETIPEQPTVPRKTTDLDDFMASIRKLSTRPACLPSATRDEYAEWVATTDPGDCLVDNPIQYWLLRRRQYPRLSRMAIDVFSIPAMSTEPERIFSLAGQMVTAQRGRLQADIIGAAQCISSWEKSGVIQISK